MLLFGHIGLTLGAGFLGEKLIILISRRHPRILRLTGRFSFPGVNSEKNATIREEFRQTAFLVAGSMLPDIIDKPVGNFLFNQTFGHNGRIFCHTLLFALMVLLAGIIYYRLKGKNWYMVLSFGVFMHLILDFMWGSPETLFWPFLGVSFPRLQIGNYLSELWHNLVSSPFLIASETAGLAITILFLGRLGRDWLSARTTINQKQ